MLIFIDNFSFLQQNLTMNDLSPYLGFAAVSLAIALSPGPSWIYVLSSTLGHGRGGGFAAAAGNSTGILCHAALAVLGLSAIVAWSPIAFFVVKMAGAAYLVYLGIRLFIRSGGLAGSVMPANGTKSKLKIYRDGIFVNLLNPKMAILMLSLLPQFIRPEAGHPTLQIAVMGGMHAVIAGTVLTNVVLFSSTLTRRIGRSPRVQQLARWATGSFFLFFGIRLAFARM